AHERRAARPAESFAGAGGRDGGRAAAARYGERRRLHAARGRVRAGEPHRASAGLRPLPRRRARRAAAPRSRPVRARRPQPEHRRRGARLPRAARPRPHRGSRRARLSSRGASLRPPLREDPRMRINRVPPKELLRIAQMALAAGAAWELALQLPNHGRPFFAPIAAVIALGAERGRRGKQAMAMMVGVAVGILVGAGVVAVAGTGGWQLVVAVGISLFLTSTAGGGPLLRNQAAASVVLIVALHTPGQNLALQRLVD